MTALALVAGMVLCLVGLAALPFVARRFRPPGTVTGPAAAARGRRVRGGILIGLALLWLSIGLLMERKKIRDNEEADRKAGEVAATVIVLAEADRPRFIRAARSLLFGERDALLDDLHLRSATGDFVSSAITSHQVEVGRATRCVRVTVQRDAPPRFEVKKRRC